MRLLPLCCLVLLTACPGLEPLPEGFGKVSEPQARLGRMLFQEQRLSASHALSCASCHPLERFGADGLARSAGHGGQPTRRNSPTVLNAAGQFAQFWDGREKDVEAQALGPLLSPVEMASDEARVLDTLRSMPGYVEAFRAAFPGEAEAVTLSQVARALGAFERTLATPSRFDAFLRGDATALSAEEQRGYERFQDLGCVNCHDGALVGGGDFRKLGDEKPWPHTSDLGRYEVTGDRDDRLVFKVPSLRNVGETAPYFHDGSVETLEEAVRLMGHHQLGETLSDADIRAVAAFLRSLTGEVPASALAPVELPASTSATPAPSP